MDGQTPPLSLQDTTRFLQQTQDHADANSPPSEHPPAGGRGILSHFSPFWRDRLIEGGFILTMLLYYIVGNPNLHIHLNALSQHNPLLSLPFLLIFALLCWYRLPFAIALLPLSLPYYLPPFQKEVLSIGHYRADFSLVEVTLWTCVAVALVQAAVQRRNWAYRLSWAEMRERIGPFLLPIVLFLAMAAFSIVIAYNRATAARSFREEVLGPLVYLVLALFYLRTRSDVKRLLYAMVGTALIIALFAIVQYVFFKKTLPLESDGIRRVHTVYGSANSIGLLLDYTLPIGFAWLLVNISWRRRIIAALVCIPLFIALYLSQSHGAWIAISVSILATFGFIIRSRRVLLIGAIAVVVAFVILVVAFPQVFDYIFAGHTNQHGVSTLQRRLYLWESAWNMIRAYPWFGVGMDNWLCYYSKNTICDAHAYHYWIVNYPPHPGPDTGLRDEPNLSHPHNIFLHVWVSIGVFGLLAFIAVLALFWQLFFRMLARVQALVGNEQIQTRWMVIGIGAAMVAALVQGQGDSAFLEQDLAFLFWILVTALLLLRAITATPWRNRS